MGLSPIIQGIAGLYRVKHLPSGDTIPLSIHEFIEVARQLISPTIPHPFKFYFHTVPVRLDV